MAEIFPFLKRPIEESVHSFKTSSSLEDVAETLEVPADYLKKCLYGFPSHKAYRTFSIPKKTGGDRKISVPPNGIALLQSKFKTILDAIYEPKICVFGFVKGKSIKTGALAHKKKAKWVLNIDIKDFYDSIHFGRVFGLFKSLGVNKIAAAHWGNLVTCSDRLPQGASTSPVISNMISLQLDNKLLHLAKGYSLVYTRYADDISFSTTKKGFPKEFFHFKESPDDYSNIQAGKLLENAITSAGFQINEKKTRLYSKHVRQEITGLTVNEFVNVRRSYIRQIRAMIHAVEKYHWELAGKEYIDKYMPTGRCISDFCKECPGEYFKCVLYGKLAFLKMIRGGSDIIYTKFCTQLVKLDESPPKSIQRVADMAYHFDVFICHASEDKDAVAKPLCDSLEKAGIKPFIDDKYIKWGDSIPEVINHALSRAKIVLIIISERSLKKSWPKKELSSALAREIEEGIKVLPLLVGNRDVLLKEVPLLQDKHHKIWEENPDELAKALQEILQE